MTGHTNQQIFGRYELCERLAVGGMAEIFRARLLGASGFAKEVVLKRIHSSFCEDDEFIEMFINEARLAAMLDHSNIVKVIDFDQVDDNYYIAMEYIKGMDLRGLMSRAFRQKIEIPVQLSLQIAIHALKGLAHAHEYEIDGFPIGIVHRDVSPHNILLSERGDVKIADFGIARVESGISRTACGVLKGKASYMAPEQTYTSAVDAQADVFALGIILWELLCHRRLFKDKNDLLTIRRVREAPIVPPHEINPQVSPELSSVVMWALQRDKRRRAPGAKALAHQLYRFVRPGSFEDELGALMSYLEKARVAAAKARRTNPSLCNTPSFHSASHSLSGARAKQQRPADSTPSRDSFRSTGSFDQGLKIDSKNGILCVSQEFVTEPPVDETLEVRPSDFLVGMPLPNTVAEVPARKAAECRPQPKRTVTPTPTNRPAIKRTVDIDMVDYQKMLQDNPEIAQLVEQAKRQQPTQKPSPVPVDVPASALETSDLPPGYVAGMADVATKHQAKLTIALEKDAEDAITDLSPAASAVLPAPVSDTPRKTRKGSSYFASLAMWGGVSIFGLSAVIALLIFLR